MALSHVAPREERCRRGPHRGLARQVRHRCRVAAARRCGQQRASAEGDCRYLERGCGESARAESELKLEEAEGQGLKAERAFLYPFAFSLSPLALPFPRTQT